MHSSFYFTFHFSLISTKRILFNITRRIFQSILLCILYIFFNHKSWNINVLNLLYISNISLELLCNNFEEGRVLPCFMLRRFSYQFNYILIFEFMKRVIIAFNQLYFQTILVCFSKYKRKKLGRILP